MASKKAAPAGRAPRLSERHRRRIGEQLLRWYARHQRRLPWRERPEPYVVWVSEIMLQQTRVETAIPYFHRFMARFPDLDALARARDEDVFAVWQGLGYYSRARGLLEAARRLKGSGRTQLPSTVDELRSLPGIGPYTAGAIASIAFERDEPVVDGNVSRVLARLFALHGELTRGPLSRQLWELARALLVPGRARDFNQALMELGALVCRPKNPDCPSCPLAAECRAHAEGAVDVLPTPQRRPAVERVRTVAAILWKGDEVLVARAPETASRWASLWVFPWVELAPRESAECGAERALREWAGLEGTSSAALGALTHTVTRFRISLVWHEVTAPRRRPTPRPHSQARFRAPRDLLQLAMPTPHRQIANRLTAP